MTNLPITPSAPQIAAIPAQDANNTETGDTQNSPTFGEVLARQAKEPAAKNARGNNKLTVDVLAQLGVDSTDEKQADIATDGTSRLPTDMPAVLLPQIMNTTATPASTVNTDADAVTGDIKGTAANIATDGTSRLPTDMLAALLPQLMNTTATPASTVNADADAVTGDTKGTALDTRATALKSGAAAEIQIGAVSRTATAPTSSIQIKEQSFAAALTYPANHTASEIEWDFAVPREIIAAATTPLPNASALASLQNTVAPVLQTARTTISTPVTHERWSDEFSQKVTWLASSRQDQSAELHLNPPQLGPLDVVIKVSGDQATALFISPHAAVREAIEQALPRLRDMLSDNGIMLGNATVSDQSPRDQNGADTRRSSTPASRDTPGVSAINSHALRVSQISRHNGIVDTFA